jgi:hypothetical protein
MSSLIFISLTLPSLFFPSCCLIVPGPRKLLQLHLHPVPVQPEPPSTRPSLHLLHLPLPRPPPRLPPPLLQPPRLRGGGRPPLHHRRLYLGHHRNLFRRRRRGRFRPKLRRQLPCRRRFRPKLRRRRWRRRACLGGAAAAVAVHVVRNVNIVGGQWERRVGQRQPGVQRQRRQCGGQRRLWRRRRSCPATIAAQELCGHQHAATGHFTTQGSLR